MKSIQQFLLLISIVFASCQCAIAAEQTLALEPAMAECHDEQAASITVEGSGCESCALDATANTFDTQKVAKSLHQLAVLPHTDLLDARMPEQETARAVDFRRGPPKLETPASRFDCLLN